MKQFLERFGGSSESIRLFFAPGRVNLIGDHTDYSGGYVLPAALDFGTWMAIRKRQDDCLRMASTSFAHVVTCDTNHLEFRAEDGWGNYPKGVLSLLKQRGVDFGGFDILFHGNIPNGAGLSSSASIEMVTAIGVCALANAELSIIDLVKLTQQAENQYMGVNCGIMDQFAVGMGKQDHAMFLRCNTLEYRYVPLTLGDYRLVVINSNKRRELADSKYNERRQECEDGFTIIQSKLAEAKDLGSVSVDEWEKVRELIKIPTISNRLEHVVYENDRVKQSTEALKQGDLIRFGQYMVASHHSLRHFYEVSCFELDTLVEEALQMEGCIGARMTGAGFGGCTVNVVHKERLAEFGNSVAQQYTQKTGFTADFYVCNLGEGAREIAVGEDKTWPF
ncbi:galactokinase [Brevibacillus sp. SYSU BS000544]|uniref:galactokinase n=1 Tax=Brevibacillus sp. SYSU BS000544 TaxID=3416443 RepID=UPI003CE5C15B